MKKTLFFVMALAAFLTSCKDKSLKYSDSDPIQMIFEGPSTKADHQIQVTSDYHIDFYAINDDTEIITVTGKGVIHGKNVGNAKVRIENGHDNMTVGVKVNLFKEPTFEFGCNSAKIRQLYGSPTQSISQDTVVFYRYTSDNGYSFACGEMDFFFINGEYYESDVYIKNGYEALIDNYLEEKFVLDTIVGDTLSLYRYKSDNSIVCGKFASHNSWEEWCLFYLHDNQAKSAANVLNKRPRSSKFLY